MPPPYFSSWCWGHETPEAFLSNKSWLHWAAGLAPPALTASPKGAGKHSLSYPREWCPQAGRPSALPPTTIKTDAVLCVGTGISTSTSSHLHIQGIQLDPNKTLTSCYPPDSVLTGWHCQTCTTLTCWHQSLNTFDPSLTGLSRLCLSLILYRWQSLGSFYHNHFFLL